MDRRAGLRPSAPLPARTSLLLLDRTDQSISENPSRTTLSARALRARIRTPVPAATTKPAAGIRIKAFAR